MQWMYFVRWSLWDVPCPGEREIIRMIVPAGAPIPDEVLAKHEFFSGYAVCIDFLTDREIKRWSPECKAAARRRNMERRINKRAPLFAEELIARELDSRPDYFSRKTVDNWLIIQLSLGEKGGIRGISGHNSDGA